MVDKSYGYDPIFLAQDIPRGMRYSIPTVKQKNATIKVLTNYGGDDYPPTILDMTLSVTRLIVAVEIET